MRKYSLIDEVERVASRVILGGKGRETIRKRIDKLVKDGVLIRKGPRKYAIIKVNKGVVIDERVKAFASEVRRITEEKKGGESIINELRVKHTERIKERIIKPWAEILERKSIDERKYYRSFSEIKSDPLYKDLRNHIPSDLEDPVTIAENIEEKGEKFEKLKKEATEQLENILAEIFKEKGLKIRDKNDIGWSAEALVGAMVDTIVYGSFDRYSDFKEILKRINANTVRRSGRLLKEFTFGAGWIIVCEKEEEELDKEEVAITIYEIFSDERIKNFAKEYKDLGTIFVEIGREKERLLGILKELEAYEILPGVCKYLQGDWK